MTDLERVLQGLDCVSGFGHCLQSEAFAGGICAYCMKEIAKKAKELLKEQEKEYEKGFNDAMLGKQELMYEGIDGKWHKKDW